jgi:glucose-6-phosphate isomerase
MQAPRCDRTAAWQALHGHFEAHGRELDLREAFARDPARFEHFCLEAAGVFADLSKNRWDLATRRFLL